MDRCGYTAENLFNDILKVVFNSISCSCTFGKSKGADGEYPRLGENEPFGLINVGDPINYAACEEYDNLVVSDRDFSGSLFNSLNDSDSTINILIVPKTYGRPE